MAISIDWYAKIISVPQADLTFVGAGVYELDLDVFRMALLDLEDSEAGMAFIKTHSHNTEVVLSGVTYARVIEIINGYTVTFEDGQYAVNLVGANSNVSDVTNVNQVSVRAQNSAGLVVIGGGAGDPWDVTVPGAYTTGKAGKVLGDLPDAIDKINKLAKAILGVSA